MIGLGTDSLMYYRPKVDVEAGYVEMEHYPYMFIHEQTGKVINKRETDETTPPSHKVSFQPPLQRSRSLYHCVSPQRCHEQV